jgi:hypothetical protein
MEKVHVLQVGDVVYANRRASTYLDKLVISRTTNTMAFIKVHRYEYKFDRVVVGALLKEKGERSASYRLATAELDKIYEKQELRESVLKLCESEILHKISDEDLNTISEIYEKYK